jgi:hypothetical protein
MWGRQDALEQLRILYLPNLPLATPLPLHIIKNHPNSIFKSIPNHRLLTDLKCNKFSFFKFPFKADDYIDEILNYDSINDAIKYEINSVPDGKIKQEPHQSVSEAEKDRQKKDNHNMSK